MKPKREAMLYHMSERLGIEIMALEVGREMFLPEQRGSGGGVETLRGANMDWMAAALLKPEEPLTWTHTHPGMGAFFSVRDVEGSHVYFDMVRRPIEAVVLGRDSRHVEVIDQAWIDAHPKPETFQTSLYHPYPRYGGGEWGGADGFGYDNEWDYNDDLDYSPTMWHQERWRSNDPNWIKTEHGWRYVGHTRGRKPAIQTPPSVYKLQGIIRKIRKVWGDEVFTAQLDVSGVITIIPKHRIIPEEGGAVS